MPKVTINEKPIEVPAGTTILQAAEKLGFAIPHYCYHPHLSIAGNCRMCLVEVEKAPKLQIACQTQVADGMVVRTQSEKVQQAVRATLEMELINHPIDCPVCDQAGECGLQDYYMRYGLHSSRVRLSDKVRKRKVIDLGPLVMLDTERCILCSRCVRFTDEVTKTHELQFFKRGDHTEIGTLNDEPLRNAYSGNVVDLCPVGALTSKDFRFKMRVWFLKSTPSVCPLCATGCNIWVDHHEREYATSDATHSLGQDKGMPDVYHPGGEVYRLRPRRNDELNQSWICDEGRTGYKSLGGENRLYEPLVRKDGKLTWSDYGEALELLHQKLTEIKSRNGAGAIGGIASPQATNEELFLFAKYFQEVLGTSLVDWRIGEAWKSVESREDEILRRLDKNPNSRGAFLILAALTKRGGKGAEEILEAARGGKVKALVFQSQEWLARYPDQAKLKEALAKVEFSAAFATHRIPELDLVHLVLPLASYAEKDGSFTNHEGRVQKIQRCFPPREDAKPGWQIMASLFKKAGRELDVHSALDAFKMLAGEVPAFKGLTLTGLPSTGTVVPIK
jgi:NADH-quinone oxidoreductase subunit G